MTVDTQGLRLPLYFISKSICLLMIPAVRNPAAELYSVFFAFYEQILFNIPVQS